MSQERRIKQTLTGIKLVRVRYVGIDKRTLVTYSIISKVYPHPLWGRLSSFLSPPGRG
jgi:hypothetical protein